MATKTKNRIETIGSVTNDGAEAIAFQEPYRVDVTIEGSAPILFHAWSCDAVEEKAAAKKGSRAKKTDNIESYVYRNDKGEICIPGSYLTGALCGAAKFLQDPRSPRKSAMDLFRAGVISETELASLGSKEWDYLDRRRVVIQRNAITRIRPAFAIGWKATFILNVLTPEYISQSMLNEAVVRAGKLIGLADHRPTFGRFNLVKFKML